MIELHFSAVEVFIFQVFLLMSGARSPGVAYIIFFLIVVLHTQHLQFPPFSSVIVQWHEVHSQCCTPITGILSPPLPQTEILSSLNTSSLSPSPSPWHPLTLLSVSVNPIPLGPSCKWSPTVFALLWLASFTKHNILQVNRYCSIAPVRIAFPLRAE